MLGHALGNNADGRKGKGAQLNRERNFQKRSQMISRDGMTPLNWASHGIWAALERGNGLRKDDS